LVVWVIFNDVAGLDHMPDLVDRYPTLEHALGCVEPKGQSRERIGHERQCPGCQFWMSVIGAAAASSTLTLIRKRPSGAPASSATIEGGESHKVTKGDVVIIPLKGEVSPSLGLFIRRAEKKAESEGATAIILDMPVVAYAEDEAATAGAANERSTIIVTARRRAEDVQQVPAAIAVVSGDTLKGTYSVNLNQVTQLVPTLNYSSPNPRNTVFTIRGLGSSVAAISQANDGLEPGVGFYVDQVYHARPATAAFDFTDLEQIEVLRGPQGTVFGKNTTAGAINITTKKPGFDFGVETEVSYGQQNFLQAKASITGAIAPGLLALRLSGSFTRRDGVLHNVRYNKQQNNLHNDAIRGQLLFTPTSNFSLRLIGDWSRNRELALSPTCRSIRWGGRSPSMSKAKKFSFAAKAANRN